MFPCRFNLSTRSIGELAARKAIASLEGHDLKDVSEYIDANNEKYKRMVEWIAKDLDVSTLRYQTLDDMVKAIGRPKEKLCLYCWTGECPKSARPKSAMDIVDVKKPSAKKTTETKVAL
jgi:amidophosphoribosyltransferase